MTTDPAPAARWQRVCRLDELPERSARGFAPDCRGDDRAFVVCAAGRVHAYRNLCPHNLRPLEYAKDRFLSADGHEIICYAHGAHFEVSSGRCTDGPCLGQSLQALQVRIEDGVIEAHL